MAGWMDCRIVFHCGFPVRRVRLFSGEDSGSGRVMRRLSTSFCRRIQRYCHLAGEVELAPWFAERFAGEVKVDGVDPELFCVDEVDVEDAQASAGTVLKIQVRQWLEDGPLFRLSL